MTRCWVTASEWGLHVPYVLFLPACLSERPTFLRRPINQVVLEEEAVEFRCQVQGDPHPTVRWKKDEIDVPRGRWDGDTLAETSAKSKALFQTSARTAIKAVCDVGVELHAEAHFQTHTSSVVRPPADNISRAASWASVVVFFCSVLRPWGKDRWGCRWTGAGEALARQKRRYGPSGLFIQTVMWDKERERGWELFWQRSSFRPYKKRFSHGTDTLCQKQ